MKWNDDENFLKDLCCVSNSYAQILRKIGVKDAGGNYGTLKRSLIKFNIVFIPNSFDKTDLYLNRRRSLDTVLVENSTYVNTSNLKKRLLKENIFQYKCYRCSRTEWEGSKIPIQLEHKNGNRTDNRIENLTLLCPNCLALTSTFCGKNKKKYKDSDIMKLREININKMKKEIKLDRIKQGKINEGNVNEVLKKRTEEVINKRIEDIKKCRLC